MISKMFEEPQAKRIRRTEIFNDNDSGSEESQEDAIAPESNIAETANEAATPAYHFDYDLIESDCGKVTRFAHLRVDEPAPQDEAEQEQEAFEFRLFSTPIPSQTQDESDCTTLKPAAIKINIRSPTPDQPSDGRFVNPYRPLSYYFAGSSPLEKFAVAAVSGSDVLQWSQDSWPGTQLPWRVIHLPSTKVSKSDVSSSTKAMLKIPDKEKAAPGKRGKPSKKRRILLRMRANAIDLKTKEKEEHLRQKKTRLNREKKVKRKAKEKAEKARLTGTGKEVETDQEGTATVSVS